MKRPDPTALDPDIGRFLQPDTIVPDPMDPQSLNRYSYVLNNPLRYTDPTGRFPLPNIHPAFCLFGIQCGGGSGLNVGKLPTFPGGQGPTGGGGINLPGPDWVWEGSSFAASVLPLSSQFCAGQAIFFGTQCITQDELGELDRGLEGLAALPGGKFGKLLNKLRLLRFADEAGELRFAGRSLEDLSSAAAAPKRGGPYTKAGSSLQSHGSRPGSAFSYPSGNATSVNLAAQETVETILTNPNSRTVVRHHALYGEVLEVKAPDGRGIRFTSSGDFIGFLEP